MAFVSLKTGSTCLVSLLALFLAFYYRPADEDLKTHLDSVLAGLLRAEKKANLERETRIAIGFGSCLDMIGDAVQILDDAQAQPPKIPEHAEQISSMEELEKMFAYFFQHGAAAERFVVNETLFTALVNAARRIPSTQYVVGGNAPVMASRFVKEGCKVLLGSQVSDSLKAQIHNIQLAGGSLQEDDIHLILEYAKGKSWGPYTSPRANRFIVHSDVNNPTLSSMELFSEELTQFSPDLLAIGGLQMMDNFPFSPGQRQARLQKLSDLLTSMPDETPIHFEMASYAEEQCLQDIIKHVVYYSDSLGMNEQELPNLHSVLTNGSVTLISDPYPRVATTLDQMRAVYHQLRSKDISGGQRKLTRLHVHTLAFQAIMTTKGSSWKNTMSAAAKASLTANRHTCGSNSISTEKARIIMDESFSLTRDKDSERVAFNTDRPVSCWDEDDYEICIAPVLVCTEVVQTAGGGDNISSAGLVLQV